jgi:hypothetical protein
MCLFLLRTQTNMSSIIVGNGGRDIFVCGDGEDTVTDYNEAEGDIATPNCENV